MTWVKLDDQFFTHPKALAAGKDGRALFIAGLCYSSAHLTDGTIPKPALSIVAAMAHVKQSSARQVVAAGLWEEHDDRYVVHDYLDHQTSRERVEAERGRAKQRKDRFKERQKERQQNGGGNAVRNGDGTDPERALEAEERRGEKSSSSNRFTKGDPDNGPDGPDDDPKTTPDQAVCTVAERRMELEHPDGAGVKNPASYRRSVLADHRERLTATAETLHVEHPDWTVEELADTLDPDSAEHAGNYLDADETRAWLDAHNQAAANAVPMPDTVKNALRP